MHDMYHGGNRELQDQFGSTALADRLIEITHRTAFNDNDRAFIEGATFFFMATADAKGRPDCSFKGGPAGFVKVVGDNELVVVSATIHLVGTAIAAMNAAAATFLMNPNI